MRINDPIGDMLTRLRNAVMRGKKQIRLPHSKIKERIAQILVNEGYLENIELTEGSVTSAQKDMVLTLKYLGKKPAIHGVERVSRPSMRVYVRHADVPNIKNGLGICVISTSSGLMTGTEARKSKIGGEILCNVW